MAPGWLWIVLTVWAAFAQTLRNAAQRHLVTDLGTLGATLVRFLFGLPFALIYFGIVLAITGDPVPGVNLAFVAWVTEGGVCQIAATALLLRVMHERNFAVGVAYSKTELIQATKDTIRANALDSCYIRPIAFRGYGEMGVNPLNAPVNVFIAVWPWGAYLGEEGQKNGIRCKVSSWRRMSAASGAFDSSTDWPWQTTQRSSR